MNKCTPTYFNDDLLTVSAGVHAVTDVQIQSVPMDQINVLKQIILDRGTLFSFEVNFFSSLEVPLWIRNAETADDIRDASLMPAVAPVTSAIGRIHGIAY